MANDPEELQRSIERTRDELARTVDTIAQRLDPKRAAKRGLGAVRHGANEAFDTAKTKLHLGNPGNHPAESNGHSSPNAEPSPVADVVDTEGPILRAGPSPNGSSKAGLPATFLRAAGSAKAVKSRVADAVMTKGMPKRISKPAIGVGLAAFLAFAAILVARRTGRPPEEE